LTTWAIRMGRSIHSIRMDVKAISERWMAVRRALKKEEQHNAEKLSEMAKKHCNEVFYNFTDPLEAAVFSVLLEIQKQLDDLKQELGKEASDGRRGRGNGVELERTSNSGLFFWESWESWEE